MFPKALYWILFCGLCLMGKRSDGSGDRSCSKDGDCDDDRDILRILLIGMTDKEKRKTGNMIFGKDLFHGSATGTQSAIRNGLMIEITDTPGLLELKNKEERSQSLMQSLCTMRYGPDAFLFVVSANQVLTEHSELVNTFNFVKDAVGDTVSNYFVVVVFFDEADLKQESPKNDINIARFNFKTILDDTGNRLVLLNNFEKKQPEVDELLGVIKDMVDKNSGIPYFCEKCEHLNTFTETAATNNAEFMDTLGLKDNFDESSAKINDKNKVKKETKESKHKPSNERRQKGVKIEKINLEQKELLDNDDRKKLKDENEQLKRDLFQVSETLRLEREKEKEMRELWREKEMLKLQQKFLEIREELSNEKLSLTLERKLDELKRQLWTQSETMRLERNMQDSLEKSRQKLKEEYAKTSELAQYQKLTLPYLFCATLKTMLSYFC